MTQQSKEDQLLSSTFEEASASLFVLKQRELSIEPELEAKVEETEEEAEEIETRKAAEEGVLWSVESYGSVVLPLTPDKNHAEYVYQQSMSGEKKLLRQVGRTRVIIETNDWRYKRHATK